MVDKNFEAVDNFHGHIRTQWGRLPLETTNSQPWVKVRKIQKILPPCGEFLWKNGFRRVPKASRLQ